MDQRTRDGLILDVRIDPQACSPPVEMPQIRLGRQVATPIIIVFSCHFQENFNVEASFDNTVVIHCMQ